VAAQKRTTARTAVLPARRQAPDLRRLAPSGRSILIGLAVAVLAVGAYVGARQTSVFALRTIDVRGGTPVLRAQVRKALSEDVGRSLLRVDSGAVASAIDPIPGVRDFTYDRAFPHTLQVTVHAEQPVLVVRQVPGTGAFLVAASGRVIRALAHPHLSSMPRVWVTKDTTMKVGDRVGPGLAEAASALSLLRGAPLPGGVHLARVTKKELTLVLGGGLELRLGDGGDLRLKLAIARRILRTTGAATAAGGYLDVSVPERPVLSQDSQVGG
jgi:cell division protein FtsQ